MYKKKTKIVATIGPVTESEEMLEKLFKSGVDVCRLNFSHGDFNEHGERVKNIRAVATKLGFPIAILQDLSGPKIRTGDLVEERVSLKEGKKLILTSEKVIGTAEKMSVNYEKLPQEVKKGGIIFLDDGRKKLEVLEVKVNDIICKILVGGDIKPRRGVNVPNAYLSISSITEKDKKDLAFGIKNDVDFVALSFVRRAEDVEELRRLLTKAKSKAKIISKIETQEAVDNIDAIIEATDGVMVARGDLAIEVPAQEVPYIQKSIIKKCNLVGKPVITATQMLESMINSPVPTRAEVSDVANAIFDGTDAVMLSEETTLGKYPVKAVEMMKRIAVHNEHPERFDYADILGRALMEHKSTTDSFSYAAINVRHEVGASMIVALSKSGETARMMSRHKPFKPLIVFTPDKKTYRQLSLSWGCFPILADQFGSISEVIERSRKTLLSKKLVKKGDDIVIVAGIPFGQSGGTNTLIVRKI